MKIQPNVTIDYKPSLGDVLEIRSETKEDSGVSQFDEFDTISTVFSARSTKVEDMDTSPPVFQYFKNEKFSNVTNSSFIIEGPGAQMKFEYWALSTENGSIILLSDSGRQFRPSIELGVNLTHLIAKQEFVVAITYSGCVYSWDLKNGKSVIDNVSLAPLINQFSTFDPVKKRFNTSVKIVEVHVVENGCPLIILSNDNAFRYESKLDSWINVFDPWYLKHMNDVEVKKLFKSDRILKILVHRLLKKLRQDEVRTKITDGSENGNTPNDEMKKCMQISFQELAKCILDAN
ncbi:unnamed protein product [Ambrosiozyma monospora]|uniref:Unnamed protein product n=1 Tax=Ambrosiozyma monospora TaxID=43982 RepID=A0A9W6WEQ4_AMBMO|nr:unnamed protein product [Ambrosiozyma monospora]